MLWLECRGSVNFTLKLKFHIVLCERQKQSTVVLAAPVGLWWPSQRVGCHTSIVTVIAQSISDAYHSLHLLASLSTECVSKEAHILVCHTAREIHGTEVPAP